MRAVPSLPPIRPAHLVVRAGLIRVGSRSWRTLLTLILVAASCAYVVPVERSMGLFTTTHANASTVSSGELLPPAALLANATAPGTISLSWSVSPSAITTGYAVYRIGELDADYSLVAVRDGIGTTTYVDAGLPPTAAFTYYIVALREDWTSANSVAAGAVTWAP